MDGFGKFLLSGGEIVSLDRELTGIVFAINLHPAGGQVGVSG